MPGSYNSVVCTSDIYKRIVSILFCLTDSAQCLYFQPQACKCNYVFFQKLFLVSISDTSNFNNWAPGHPKNISGNSDCLVTDSTYQWKDTSCEDWRKFVCVKSKLN